MEIVNTLSHTLETRGTAAYARGLFGPHGVYIGESLERDGISFGFPQPTR